MSVRSEATRDERPARPVRRFVSIRAAHSHEGVDLEMPGNRPLAELMPDLLKALGWPIPEGRDPSVYQLRTESGHTLDGLETFDSAGVENADVLWIGIREDEEPQEMGEDTASVRPAPEPGDGQVPGLAVMPASHTSGQERRAQLPPPVPASFKVEVPCLVSSRGVVFELGTPPAVIGRKSHGSVPDIDLTELDPEMASSRRHARVLRRGDDLLLEALPTTNGTFVNGRGLRAGEVQPLKSGDRLLFGADGVELVLVLGGETIPPSFFGSG
ncbi:MAG TPA: FHA domain-containing protein [Anaerolineales bacterium]|nr:FHA domain-containing protein [Anaerolineales bacterium]